MKTPHMHLILAAALAAGLTLAHAEDSVAPATEQPPGATAESGTTTAATATPSPTPSSSPSPETAPKPGIDEPIPLIPEGGPAPQPKESPAPERAPAQDVTGAAAPEKGSAEQLRRAIRLRQLRTQVSQEPDVLEQLHTAQHAKTQEGYRTAKRNYYTLIGQKIEKIDPSYHDQMEVWLYNHLFQLEQHRVRPSKLIEPIKPLPGSHSADHAAAAKAHGATGSDEDEEGQKPSPTPPPTVRRPRGSNTVEGIDDGR